MTAAEKIKAKEDELRAIRRREMAVAVDSVGNIVLEKVSETDFEIALTEEEVERLRNAEGVVFTTITHEAGNIRLMIRAMRDFLSHRTIFCWRVGQS